MQTIVSESGCPRSFGKCDLSTVIEAPPVNSTFGEREIEIILHCLEKVEQHDRRRRRMGGCTQNPI
jgi:hypothetical protein